MFLLIIGNHCLNRININNMGSVRRYNRKFSVTFAKTTAKYGVFSNMVSGMSLYVNDINIPSTEALYQACKFPLNPEIQELIISESNAMKAKKIAVKYARFMRPDWDLIKYDVMRWCIKVKYYQNKKIIESLLLSTGDSPIVEYSKKDDIWGAIPINDEELVGTNALGRLLMELRQQIKDGVLNEPLLPPRITGFLLYGHEIQEVYSSEYYLFDDFNIK